MADSFSRKHIRFEPDQNTLITLKLTDDEEIIGLAFSEAHGGCGGVFLNNKYSKNIVANQTCKLVVGEIIYHEAEIRWVQEVDKDIIKVGFKDLNI